MIGNEKFIYNSNDLEFGLLDLWQYKYSNIYNMQEVIAEFIVEKALGLKESQNTNYWTLYDILYRGYRIEIKETSYYHPWNVDGKISNQRTFGITKANSNYENPELENKFERQNDIYVFCLNTGSTKESSNPMNLDNWEFYIVPTSVINEECGNNKTISLNKVKKLSKQITYGKIKETIDLIIDKHINDNITTNKDDNLVYLKEENKKTLIDELDNIKTEEWKQIFCERLKGKTLNDIGKKYDLSRERVRVIIDKILEDMSLIKEDEYKEIFEKYFIEQELFCNIFNEEPIVYKYLNLKYSRGFNSLIDLYNSFKLNAKQNKILKEYIESSKSESYNENWNVAFKEFLSSNSLTAKKVAELTGLSKPTIDSYMQGKRKPTDENKRIIKEKLGFEVLKSIYNI